MTIEVRSRAGGCSLPVRVRPGGRRDAVEGEHAGALRVCVTAAPERGAANEAVRALLAQALDVRASRISLIRGSTSREKVFMIAEMNEQELRTRLSAVCAAASPERAS